MSVNIAPTNSIPGKPGNPWLIFILICIPILIGSIDLTAIVVILPQATLDLLGPQGLNRADQALWAVTAYLLAYTISLALVGRLSDVLPRKLVFLTCIVIFVIGAVWSAFATDLPLQFLKLIPGWPEPAMLPLISLVIGRVIQAIGAGASVSVGMALVSDVFPPEKRAEPISLIGALDSLGWVVGNLYAGLLLQILPSWRWLFLINAVVAVIALAFTVMTLRATRSARAAGARFDLRGAALFAAALIALTIGVEALNAAPTEAYLLLGASSLMIGAFVWLQARTRNALIDMKFVARREVRAALATNLIVGFGLILVVAGVPLIINLRAVFLRGEGLLTGALRAGIMLTALTVPLVVATLVGEGRYRRVGVGMPVALGLGTATIGFLATGLWTYTAPAYVIALPLALIGVGLGLTIGPLSLVVVDAAEESARGLASSLVLVMRLLGMTIGTPLAAALTLNLANEWASQRAEILTPELRNVARPMLVPPMAIDALAKVMLIGAAASATGLLLFYLPRAYATLRRVGLSARVVFSGLPALALVVALVGGFAVWDANATPAVLPNPIAQQLPPNVEFYAGFNLQQAFLLNSRRPLDALVEILNLLAAGPEQEQAPAQPAPLPAAGPDTPTDSIVKTLFRPRQWSQESYKTFCAEELPRDKWQECFNLGLLGWIGPQAAFALLPRTRPDYDYLFVFQATNRNNAIQFATNLAAALAEQPPREAYQNVHLLDINAEARDARRLAITDAYVVLGTPTAIDYMLNHGSLSLADHPNYRAVIAQLPPNDFATFYFRSGNFDFREALIELFQSPVIDSLSRILGRFTPLAFTRTSNAPAVIGMAMRVDEQRLYVNVVANLPVSLQKLNAAPVSRALLGFVPDGSRAWSAANLNIAGLIRDVNIPETLETIARESGSAELRALLANPLAQGPVTAFAQTLQSLLTHTTGQMVMLSMPGAPTAQAGVVLPLTDLQSGTAAGALDRLRTQLQLFGALTGELTVHTGQIEGYAGEIITIGGKFVEGVVPGGVQYTLTEDNLLVVALGDGLPGYLRALRPPGGSEAAREIAITFPDTTDRFLYAYILPPTRSNNAALTLGSAIRQQALYLDLILHAKE